MEKKLFRNEHDKMIAGVASGLADYMQIEVTIVRLLFALSTIFMAGGGLIAYIIMWIILPVNNDPTAKFNQFNDYFKKNNPNMPPFNSPDPNAPLNWSQPLSENQKTPFETHNDFSKFNKPNDTGRTVGGLLLLVIGCYFLMRELDFIPHWFRIRNLWPVIFIALGISFIARSKKKNDWKEWQNQQMGVTDKKEDPTPVVPAEQEHTNDTNNTDVQSKD